MLGLNKSSGVWDPAGLNFNMYLSLLGIHLICYFALWKGVSISGKVRGRSLSLVLF